MADLVHQEVARTRQVKVACTKPAAACCGVGNGLGGRIRIVAKLGTSDVATSVINPNRTKCNLRVCMGLRSIQNAIQVKREVGGITILDRLICLRTRVRLQADVQLVTTIHDASLAVRTMATTGRQNHGDGIGRQNRTRVDVTAIGTHQSVHVPVAVINVRNRVQNIVTGRTIVLIGTKAAALFVITSARVRITSIMCIIPRTSVGVHSIVTNAHAVALAQECLNGIVGFAGKVGLLINANAPTD